MNTMKTAVKYSENTRKENLVEVITEYREANVVIGGKVYMSAEDAKSILMLTNETLDGDEMNTMLYQCREILRSMAKQVLYQPSDTEIGLIDIIQKYK